MDRYFRHFGLNAKVWLGLAALLLGLWHGTASAGQITYGGRATVINAGASIATINASVVEADTGELAPSGAERDATVASVNNPAPLQIDSQTLSAQTVGYNNLATSDASVENLQLVLPGLNLVAGVVQAYTQAECGSGGLPAVDGGASVVDLTINGKAYRIDNKPNQAITIPGVATVIIDERTITSSNNITVNAIHVKLAGVPKLLGADVVISHADSQIYGCSAGQYPQPQISCFTPISGAPGTVVTVDGSAFTGITQAWVGTAHDAPVRVISDSQVQVTIPADATNGAIGIGNGENWAFTDRPFTVTP